MHIGLLLGLAAIASLAAFTPIAGRVVAAPAAAETWRSYHNDRYGTTIDYPDVFKAEPPPDSDDGRTFKTADGARFSVSASYNALDFDLGNFHDFIVQISIPAKSSPIKPAATLVRHFRNERRRYLL